MTLTLTTKTIQQINKQAHTSNVDLFSELKGAKAKTWNNAVSYSIGNHDPRVVLFTKSVRGMDCKNPSDSEDHEKYLEFLLDESWKKSPIDTLRSIFYIRDCRGGKGEKLLFFAACRWLMENHSQELVHNLIHIPFYGSWKDLFLVFCGTEYEKIMIKFYTDQLKSDKAKLNTEDKFTIDTCAAKYSPNEKGEYDKKFKMVTKFCSDLNTNKAGYRKLYLRPLRSARTTIVEELMCAKDWNKIDFSKVPSIAMKRYKNAFQKQCPERYNSFLEKVMKGTTKINVGVLDPVDIISDYVKESYYSRDSISLNKTIEAQWLQLLKDRSLRRLKIAKEANTKPVNALAIIDVSGSMFTGEKTSPIKVALSLGLMIACLNDVNSPFYKKWVTFSTNPKLETLKGESLCYMIKNIDYNNWEMATNFQAVFEMMLNTAVMYKVPKENMPQMLVVISDMQFNEADDNSTNWEALELKYAKAGYKRPTLVFWNVSSHTLDMPVPHSDVENCCVMGGYSANLLDPLVDGIVPSPMGLLRKVLDSERYSRVNLPKLSNNNK